MGSNGPILLGDSYGKQYNVDNIFAEDRKTAYKGEFFDPYHQAFVKLKDAIPQIAFHASLLDLNHGAKALNGYGTLTAFKPPLQSIDNRKDRNKLLDLLRNQFVGTKLLGESDILYDTAKKRFVVPGEPK
jgi:hypothetical protein